MFSIMGNCMSWVKKRREPKRKVTLAIFGLDNAGKTVTTKGLQGESLETVAPTIGFSTVEFQFEKHDITMFDLGGGKRIRDIWKNYFSEVYGLIFVVDSTDPDRMEECRQVLNNLLEEPKISGKPVLLLANKQDMQGAMDELDVCQHLNLEEMVNINKCPCRVETCSAILGQGKKMDKSIKNGMKWLLTTIGLQWEKLSLRVEKDMAEQKEQEAHEKKRRTEMVRKKREERERKEKEERRLRGEPEEEDEEDGGFTNGDPFKRVDVDELTRKQQQLKEEKLKKKLQDEQSRKQTTKNALIDSDDSDEKPAPRSSRSHSRRKGDRESIIRSDDDPFSSNRHSKTSHRSHTPSPENTPRLSRRKLKPLSAQSDEEEQETSFASKSPWLKKRSPRPLEAGSLSGRMQRSRGDEDEGELPTPPRGRTLMPIGHLEPLDTDRDFDGASVASSDNRVDNRRKKKKKKARRNQVSATEEDDPRSDTASITSTETPAGGQPLGWGTPPGQRSLLKASRSPRLEAPQEEPEPDAFAQRWGLAEDLPDMPDNASYRRTRPNTDFDEDIIT